MWILTSCIFYLLIEKIKASIYKAVIINVWCSPGMEESLKGISHNDKGNVKMEYTMKCGLCKESYSGDRIPRILPCGHSMCGVCTNQKLPYYKACTDCLAIYNSKDLKDLPINYPVKRFLWLNESNNFLGTINPASMLFPPSDQELDFWKCPVHESITAFLCITCSVWVCRDCLVVDHPQFPRENCRIVSVNMGIEILRSVCKRKAKRCIKRIKDFELSLDDDQKFFDILTEHCPDEWKHNRVAGYIERLLDVHEKETESTLDSVMAQIKRDLKIWKTTSSIIEITTCCKNLVESENNLIKKDREKTSMFFRQEASLHLRMDLKLLIREGKQVYAVQQANSLNETMWAQVTQTGDRLLVSSLREGSLPAGGLIIPYEYVRQMVHKNYPSVFFELGTKDTTEGTIYVRLFKNCFRVQSIVLYCTGETGLCYRGTSLFKLIPKIRRSAVCGGNFQNSLCNVMINDSSDKFKYPFPKEKCLKSKVEKFCYFSGLENMVSVFGFPLVDVTGKRLGRVTQGKELIQILYERKSVSKMIVRECGLIIPRNLEDDPMESLLNECVHCSSLAM